MTLVPGNTPTPTPAPKSVTVAISTHVSGIMETVLGDLSKVASALATGTGTYALFASHFSGGQGELGMVLSGVGVVGFVASKLLDVKY